MQHCHCDRHNSDTAGLTRYKMHFQSLRAGQEICNLQQNIYSYLS